MLRILYGIIIGVLLAGAVAEGVLRLAGYENTVLTQFDPDLGRVGRPGLSGVQSIEGRSHVEFNSKGYHDFEHSPRRVGNAYRIVVLGDSFSAAVQVDRQNTYSQRLTSELESCSSLKGKTVEIVNLAIDGYNLHQMYLTERAIVPSYEPDLILVAVTPNPSLLERGVPEQSLSPVVTFDGDKLSVKTDFRQSATFKIKTSKPYAAFLSFSDHSRLLQYIMEVQFRYRTRHSADLEVNQEATDPSGGSPFAWASTKRLLREIAATASAQGAAAFFVLTAPDEINPMRVPSTRIYERDMRYVSIMRDLGVPFISISNDMRAYAVANRVFLNGFGAFGSGSGHWNRVGHKVAAELYARGICNWLNAIDQKKSQDTRQGGKSPLHALAGPQTYELATIQMAGFEPDPL